MDNIKNAIIALLTGLLALTLFTQSAQSATKTYDAVKLVEYEACITGHNAWDTGVMMANDGSGTIDWSFNVLTCAYYKPKG